jgi:hypothetical protein
MKFVVVEFGFAGIIRTIKIEVLLINKNQENLLDRNSQEISYGKHFKGLLSSEDYRIANTGEAELFARVTVNGNLVWETEKKPLQGNDWLKALLSQKLTLRRKEDSTVGKGYFVEACNPGYVDLFINAGQIWKVVENLRKSLGEQDTSVDLEVLMDTKDSRCSITKNRATRS